MAFPVRAQDEFPGNNGKARVAKQALHHILIHAGGGGKHAGSDVGNIRQFQKSLHRTVFAEGPVQDGENDIDGRAANSAAGRGRRQRQKLGPGGIHGRRNGLAALQDLRQELHGVRSQPASVPRG